MSVRVPSCLWRLKSGLWLLPLALLWFSLIRQLSVEWNVNPQYAYGWAVPFLCVYLLWRRLRVPVRGHSPDSRHHGSSSFLAVLGVLCALLWLPTRLVQEANPEWRLVSWAMALVCLGLTFCVARVALGPDRWTQTVFPLGFFLVAVPWPTVLEGPLIQTLMRANVAVSVELLNAFGIPALQHGNVIEVATGLVGIDEACSGIRSVQATLMLSLFFGEWYALSAMRRGLCVAAGFALAFVFNLGRSTLLTAVAAREGVAAIGKWHDPAGVTILVGCFTGLWLISRGLRPRGRGTSGAPPSPVQPDFPPGRAGDSPGTAGELPATLVLGGSSLSVVALPLALCAWLVSVEIGTALWYRSHERHLPAPVEWTVRWPADAPGYRELPFSEKTRRFLRFAEGRNVQWREAERAWQGIFLRWQAGRIAARLARGHLPETCLPAAGHAVEVLPGRLTVTVSGLRLPFRAYALQTERGPAFVFYCLWEDRRPDPEFDRESLTYETRLAAVRAGRRNLGQRSLELAVWGIDDPAEAEAALRAQLEKLIVVQP
jgi:exosortase